MCPVPLSTFCNVTAWLCPVVTGNGDVCKEHLGLVAALKSVKCVDSPPARVKASNLGAVYCPAKYAASCKKPLPAEQLSLFS